MNTQNYFIQTFILTLHWEGFLHTPFLPTIKSPHIYNGAPAGSSRIALIAQFFGWFIAYSTAFATSFALRYSVLSPYSANIFNRVSGKERNVVNRSTLKKRPKNYLTSGFIVFACNSVVVSPGWMHVTFMLLGTTSCLIASETHSAKYLVPEYTAKPANGWKV